MSGPAPLHRTIHSTMISCSALGTSLSPAYPRPPTGTHLTQGFATPFKMMKAGLIPGKPSLNLLKMGHSGASYRRFLKMSFYVLSSRRSVAGTGWSIVKGERGAVLGGKSEETSRRTPT